MSPQNRSTLVGLAAPGLFWMATSVAMGQGGIALQAPPSSPASTPTASTYSVLLMTDNRVVRGTITRDPSGANYILKQGGVPIAYPSSMVQKAGGSVDELYLFLVSRLAGRDPDERMKLARWSLTNGLPERAKQQVAAVLEMAPGDPEASRMEYNLAATAERAAQIDPAVRQASGEMPPADLNPQALKKVRGDFNALPVIFDLPPAQAVDRARDFTRKVHPILQIRCASCHNERYQGAFQLVVAKGTRDMNPDVARANLDATLRLINPDDPARSEILSAALVPHGPKKNAIFRGPNDPEYRIIADWARALQATSPGTNAVVRTGFGGFEAAPAGDGFAADRPNRARSTGLPLTPVVPVPGNGGFPPLPGAPAQDQGESNDLPPGYLPGESYKLRADVPGSPPDSAFEVPYAAGGGLPPALKAAQSRNRTATSPGTVATATPAVVPTTATQVDAKTVLVAPTEDPNQLPGMNQQRYPPKGGAGASAKKVKAPDVDRALLEQLIKQRNGTP